MRETVVEKSLLSRPEQVLYGRLVRAFPGHVILAHVALSRLAAVGRPRTAAGGQAVPNRSCQLVADFVVCRPDFTALAAVELDDRAKSSDAQRERGRRKEQFLRAAGIKLLRVPLDDIPPEAALKALVAAVPLNASTAQPMRRAS